MGNLLHHNPTHPNTTTLAASFGYQEQILGEMFPFFPKEYIVTVLNQCNRDLIAATKVCAQQKQNLVQLYANQSQNTTALTLNNLMLSLIQQQNLNNANHRSAQNSQQNQSAKLPSLPQQTDPTKNMGTINISPENSACQSSK